MQHRRDTKFLVVHCSATPPRMDIGAEDIRRWHIEDRHWSDIGYHWVITRDGTLETGRAEEFVGAGVQGFNNVSIHVCLVGGVKADGKTPEDNFTLPQWKTLGDLMDKLHAKYPDATIQGHRDFPNVGKECPSFDVKRWWEVHQKLSRARA